LADLKETIEQEVAAIDCEIAHTPLSSKGLNLAFKHMDITCLTLFFTDNKHFKWH
jgi:hypothetical protein